METYSVSAYADDIEMLREMKEDFRFTWRSEIVRLAVSHLHDVLYQDEPTARTGAMEMVRKRTFMKKRRNSEKI
jgi:hypothetical protein